MAAIINESSAVFYCDDNSDPIHLSMSNNCGIRFEKGDRFLAPSEESVKFTVDIVEDFIFNKKDDYRKYEVVETELVFSASMFNEFIQVVKVVHLDWYH